MKVRAALIPIAVVAGVTLLVAAAARDPLRQPRRSSPANVTPSLSSAVATVDDYLNQSWTDANITPAEPADDLQILRRLSLALHGTIPSLEEIRQFQTDTQPNKLRRWTRRLLDDPRFADYFAQRLARVYVGVDEGPFIIFRRDRLTDWLSNRLQADHPYDETVRHLIAETGLWTGAPAVNFVTSARIDEDFDENKLAGRTVRAFLGQRIDCAQCHDHPFRDWTQDQFEGLAAHFGQVSLSPFGLEDIPQEYTIQDRETLEDRTVVPSVPFSPTWLPAAGTSRGQLAAWLTHPENRRFRRATVNRVWGLLFGRAYLRPVDDLDDPPSTDAPDLLDLLADDFAAQNYSIKHLIETITATQAFRAASTIDGSDDSSLAAAENKSAVFPLVRLRPEQVIGAILQAASVQTIDRNSHLLVRTIRLIREGDFIREYGDLGSDELQERGGTIPQRLVLMNGDLVRELMESNLFNSVGGTATLAPTDEQCIETAFLICLSRKPTPPESAHFVAQLQDSTDESREQIVEDLFWSLLNTTEFSWNH
ncbi:hypothetical protein CA54_06550 [Symmachiella macrocystis]|uniref:Cytochrome c domain-containing protein n=1 Tax=Symmachiella macrocystis TaxID=2527985 RepID=A0A5C6BI35_9PLAN|nr:DUF1549 domain-containing protein [Symmachiella macrocystis]TWU11843.1 hypothetical protein CA54_06550 [Symmachiella macrocystis]